jgi:GntR family transcriptional regulator
MLVDLDPKDPTPIYAQLERGIRAAIAIGRLSVGEQLPTVRQLAVSLRVNANTVARVYMTLEREGVVETRRGVGTFVRVGPDQALSPHERAVRLRAFATKLLSSAMALGFTIDEVTAEVDLLIKEEADRFLESNLGA